MGPDIEPEVRILEDEGSKELSEIAAKIRPPKLIRRPGSAISIRHSSRGSTGRPGSTTRSRRNISQQSLKSPPKTGIQNKLFQTLKN
jgi:hypothetical protein